MTENPREQRAKPPTRFLRLPEVLERTGLSRSTIYVRLANGSFPRPVPLGARAVGWIEAEVDEWVRERIAESRFDEAACSKRSRDSVSAAPWSVKQASLPCTLTQIRIFLCFLSLRDSAARFPPNDSLRLGSQVRSLGRLSNAVRSCPASAC